MLAGLSARKVSQRLREAALGVLPLRLISRDSEGEVCVDIGGWTLTLSVDDEGLARCLSCRTDTGTRANLEDWPRYGSNPTDLLSLWERQRLEQLLIGHSAQPKHAEPAGPDQSG